jgi:transposase
MVDQPAIVAKQAVRSGRADDRRVLNGIYWRLRTSAPWADIPERYGPATTCASRFQRWAKIGVWDRIFEAYDGDLQLIGS